MLLHHGNIFSLLKKFLDKRLNNVYNCFPLSLTNDDDEVATLNFFENKILTSFKISLNASK